MANQSVVSCLGQNFRPTYEFLSIDNFNSDSEATEIAHDKRASQNLNNEIWCQLCQN